MTVSHHLHPDDSRAVSPSTPLLLARKADAADLSRGSACEPDRVPRPPPRGRASALTEPRPFGVVVRVAVADEELDLRRDLVLVREQLKLRTRGAERGARVSARTPCAAAYFSAPFHVFRRARSLVGAIASLPV
jgi:hypothetical protein